MKRPLLAIAAILAAAPAWTHDTWLLPEAFRVEPGGPIIAHATSAMHFPAPETPVQPDRIVRSGVRAAAITRDLVPASATKAFLPLRATIAEPAVAALWMESRPRTLDLDDSEVEHYLKEIGAWETVGAKWREGGRKPWRETYAKCAKAFVRVGEPSGDRSWAEPVGMALELVPESDPTSVDAGASIRFKLLRGGAPVVSHSVAAQAAGKEAVLRQTGSDGTVSFVLDQAGPWLVKATDIRSGAREGEWESRFTTVTFAVNGPR